MTQRFKNTIEKFIEEGWGPIESKRIIESYDDLWTLDMLNADSLDICQCIITLEDEYKINFGNIKFNEMRVKTFGELEKICLIKSNNYEG